MTTYKILIDINGDLLIVSVFHLLATIPSKLLLVYHSLTSLEYDRRELLGYRTHAS